MPIQRQRQTGDTQTPNRHAIRNDLTTFREGIEPSSLAASGPQVTGGSGFLTKVDDEGVLHDGQLTFSSEAEEELLDLRLGGEGFPFELVRSTDGEQVGFVRANYFEDEFDRSSSMDFVLSNPDVPTDNSFAGIGMNVNADGAGADQGAAVSMRASLDEGGSFLPFSEMGVSADLSEVTAFITADRLELSAKPDLLANYSAGVQGHAEITSNSNTGTTIFDITGLSVDVDVLDGRTYLILCQYHGVRSTVAGDDVQLTIADEDDNSLSQNGRQKAEAANLVYNGGTFSAWFKCLATETKTFKIRCQRVSGTGTVGISALTTAPSWIAVIDIGTRFLS